MKKLYVLFVLIFALCPLNLQASLIKFTLIKPKFTPKRTLEIAFDSHKNGLYDQEHFTKLLQKVKNHCNISGISIKNSDPESTTNFLECLPQFTSITALTLENCAMNDEHIQILAWTLPKLEKIQTLYLAKNKITDKSVALLAESFSHCPSLSVVNLKENPIQDQYAFNQAIRKHSNATLLF